MKKISGRKIFKQEILEFIEFLNPWKPVIWWITEIAKSSFLLKFNSKKNKKKLKSINIQYSHERKKLRLQKKYFDLTKLW